MKLSVINYLICLCIVWDVWFIWIFYDCF